MADGMMATRTAHAALMRRVSLRLLPFLMLCYILSVIDRVNIGFAALSMNKELGLTASIFGLGGGLFYISFFLFEVPSNLALQRFGARRWIARIMISWGLISGCMALATGPNSFIALRFLLGAAEAGFFPGIILYLTYWFPPRERARIIATFMVAIPAANFIGSPISGLLLGLDGVLGLQGWQWMFILEAAPTIAVGFACLFYLSDRPQTASWLTEAERTTLAASIAAEEAALAKPQPMSIWQVLSNRRVILLGLIYAGSNVSSTGLTLWQPQLIKSFGLSNLDTGLLNSIPFICGAIVMVLWSRRSDARAERPLHTAIALAMIAIGLFGCLFVNSLIPTIALLCLAIIGTYAMKGPFWALATEQLAAGSAAPGIAQVNAIANLLSFLAPFLVGLIKDATGSYQIALLPIVFFAALATLLVLSLRKPAALS